jgi:hypothetical protein
VSASSCTLFALSANELEPSGDSLPGYDDPSSSRPSLAIPDSALELGANWQALHAKLGGHGPDHPLGFLDGGGEVRPEFHGTSSTGRYFPAPRVVTLLAALARIARPAPEIERLRVFIADVVASERGLIVYHFPHA